MSIQVTIRPVRSRTETAGSSGSDTPRENSIPSAYSSRYASTLVTRYSSDSDGCRATRRLSYSYTLRSEPARSMSELEIVAVRAMSQHGRRDDRLRVYDGRVDERDVGRR